MYKKTILLFHINGEKSDRISDLCRALDIRTIFVKRKKYGERLGVLADIVGVQKTNKVYRGEEFSGEMMVFSGIDSDGLDVFLEKYKASGIEPVELKAVLTPVNINWTPGELYRELEKERQQIQ